MKDKNNNSFDLDVVLSISDIHNHYPQLHKKFLENKGCRGDYKLEWDTYVYTLNNKIVAIMSHNSVFNEDILTLKLRVENNMSLRDIYPGIIIPGYHMNKMHWSSIILRRIDELPQSLIYELIDESYFLIYSGLTKKDRLQIDELEDN